MKYNFQAPYYGVYTANRIELAAPYYEAVLSYLPEAKRRAREEISTATNLPFPDGLRGALYPVGIGPWGSTPDGNCHNQVSNGIFAAIPLIWHYQFTQDIEFLREKLYPLLFELADFWEDYLQEDESGRYVVHAASYEGYTDINPAQDLGFVRLLFNTLLSAGAELGRDEERRPRWREILEKLSDYPLFTYQGKLVYNRSESAGDLMVGNVTVNLEFIHPAGGLGLSSGKDRLQIAHNTIRSMDAWTQGNNVPILYLQAVQVGYPVEETVNQFKALMKATFRSNLTLYETGGGIETDGAIEAIHLMLLQSNEGFLHLFPVWFTDRNAYFKRLRARGAFLVSSEFRNGAVQYVEIFSEKGKTCRIRNPWEGKEVRVLKISPTGDSETPFDTDGIMLIFQTEPGAAYRL